MKLLPAKEVTNDNLLHDVALLRQQGYRLVTITCLDVGEGHDLLYHFDQGYALTNLRLRLKPGETLLSICTLYPAAMIVENEIKDHFGIAVSGLSIDYQGRLVLTEDAPRAPMNKSKRCGMELDARVSPATTPVSTKEAST